MLKAVSVSLWKRIGKTIGSLEIVPQLQFMFGEGGKSSQALSENVNVWFDGSSVVYNCVGKKIEETFLATLELSAVCNK